jgi:hypothetical protein
MKPSILLLVIFVIALAGPNFAQSTVDDQIQVLQRQLPGRLEARDYDGAVEIGEKIASLERSKGPSGHLLYIAALRNVAAWQRLALIKFAATPVKQREFWQTFNRRSAKATGLHREIVELLTPMGEPDLLAAAQFDLGVMLLGRAVGEKRCEEAEPLFRSVIQHEKKKDAPNPENILASLPYLIDCRIDAGDFETAFTDFESLIPLAESVWKPENRRFVPIYATYSSLLLMVGRVAEAERASERVREIRKDPDFKVDFPGTIFRRAEGRLDLVVGSLPRLGGGSNPSSLNVSQASGGNPLTYRPPAESPSDPRARQDSNVRSGTGPGAPASVGQRGQPVIVEVHIDERGNVSKAIARHPSPEVKENISKLATKWRFRPLVLNGQPRKMVGLISVAYFKKIKSEPKADPN